MNVGTGRSTRAPDQRNHVAWLNVLPDCDAVHRVVSVPRLEPIPVIHLNSVSIAWQSSAKGDFSGHRCPDRSTRWCGNVYSFMKPSSLCKWILAHSVTRTDNARGRSEVRFGADGCQVVGFEFYRSPPLHRSFDYIGKSGVIVLRHDPRQFGIHHAVVNIAACLVRVTETPFRRSRPHRLQHFQIQECREFPRYILGFNSGFYTLQSR